MYWALLGWDELMRGVKWICSHDSWRLRRCGTESCRDMILGMLRGAIDMERRVTLSGELPNAVGNSWRPDSGDAEGGFGEKGGIIWRAPHRWQQLMRLF